MKSRSQMLLTVLGTTSCDTVLHLQWAPASSSVSHFFLFMTVWAQQLFSLTLMTRGWNNSVCISILSSAAVKWRNSRAITFWREYNFCFLYRLKCSSFFLCRFLGEARAEMYNFSAHFLLVNRSKLCRECASSTWNMKIGRETRIFLDPCSFFVDFCANVGENSFFAGVAEQQGANSQFSSSQTNRE